MILNRKLVPASMKLLLAGVLVGLLVSAAVLYYRGVFDRIPRHTPLSQLKVVSERVSLEPEADDFRFCVIGDTGWETPARVAVLRDACRRQPLFMVNLGDIARWGTNRHWKKYIDELNTNLEKDIPYFHTPGRHCIDHRIYGARRQIFEHYFGKVDFCIDVRDKWRFLLLDSSRQCLLPAQLEWVERQLHHSTLNGRQVAILTHCPPLDRKDGVTHALDADSTKRLADLVQKYPNVAAIFAAHIHDTFTYEWGGVPVYVTSLSEDSLASAPARYYEVSVAHGQLRVRTVEIYNHGGPHAYIDAEVASRHVS